MGKYKKYKNLPKQFEQKNVQAKYEYPKHPDIQKSKSIHENSLPKL